MVDERTIKKLKQKKKSPEVMIVFTPDPNFEERFLDFLEKILSWKGNSNESEKEKNNNKNENK